MSGALKKLFSRVLPILFGAFVLGVIYKDLDFSLVSSTLFSGIHWGWMAASLFFGIAAQIFRGWRWRLSLAPACPGLRHDHCVPAIYLSYAISLLVPRLGEVSRCGVVAKRDGVPFGYALGTVVTERIIDSLFILFFSLFVFVSRYQALHQFAQGALSKMQSFAHLFTTVWFYVVLGFVAAFCVLLYSLRSSLSFYGRVRKVFRQIHHGMLSVCQVSRPWLFVLYSLLIWVSYFLHFYLTLYSFSFTSFLGYGEGAVLFVAGTFAVFVPTPNGAGPWHFAIISLLVFYGVSASDAGIFALIVHTLQTFLVVLLGVWGWFRLGQRIGHP